MQPQMEFAGDASRTMLEGIISRLVYHDPEGGYTVGELQESDGSVVTMVGVLPGAMVGESIRIHGAWEQHQRYGRQFHFHSYELVRPSTARGVVAYLGGGLVKGVGPRLAQGMYDHFGENLLDILDKQPERLREVSGIGRKRAAELGEAWREHQDIHRIMVFLQDHGIGPALAGRIHRQYGGEAMTIIERWPYRLAREVRGIGFLTADRIARQVGISASDPQRLQAGIVHVLDEARDEGHFMLPRESLLQQARQVLECDPQALELAAEAVREGGQVAAEKGPDGEIGIYLPDSLEAEKELAGLVLRLCAKTVPRAPSPEQVCSWLEKRRDMGAVELTAAQAEAVCTALREPVSVITGGPGTGKTTVTRAIVEAAENIRRRVALCSPTGRAAKRLGQAAGRPAATIHRLLAYDPIRGRFRFGYADPLPVDLLIVDETSMVDAFLARDLLCAVPPAAQVVFIGDVDQLPSVGPGNVLRDIIDSGTVPVHRLQEIFRQAEGGDIVRSAHLIREGTIPRFVPGNKWQGEDCVFMERETADDAAAAVIKVVTRSIPGLGYDRRDIQVISPMHRGPVGVAALNEALQEVINPPAPGKGEIRRSGMCFREGDRVLQTVNNYDKNVYNGDIGFITVVNKGTEKAVVEFDMGPVTYDFKDLDELEIAYALTIHKSQGSEYPAVVMVMHSSHYIMMKRNLLYTALTRAERLAVIVGDYKGLGKAVRTHDEDNRHTRLQHRLQGSLQALHIDTPLDFSQAPDEGENQ